MKILVAIILILFLVIVLFLHSIKICEGGRIIQGCGKLLFPWSKKYKFSDSRKYCCIDCLKRDVNLLAEEPDLNKYLISFTEKEEYDGFDRKDNDSRSNVSSDFINEFSRIHLRRREKKKF